MKSERHNAEVQRKRLLSVNPSFSCGGENIGITI